MKSIRKYMIDNGLKSGDAGVDIVTGMIDGDLQTVIVTQSCVIPHGYEGRPEANMGKREECVRQWLECNGMLSLATLLVRSHVTHRCRQGILQVGGL